ncbi:MAG: hypothetical protein KJ725_12345 [Gammaproteobacteria bacterium]|nr:hypothetical protein [Gammaproteobacteria bacterium]
MQSRKLRFTNSASGACETANSDNKTPNPPMNRTERFYAIEYLLRQQRVVPIAVFLERLCFSRSTFTRDIEYLRDRLHAPIVWDREEGGYRFDDPPRDGPPHELPGLWRGYKLGYVPRIDNAACCHLLDNSRRLSARIVALNESRNPWERIQFAVHLQDRPPV